MPLLSIIIPAYNSERFIANILSMLVSQGIDDCEIIVINDGSTDKTKQICRIFVEQHENIKLVNIKNSGVSIARNTGLRQATGKYIYFLDSDDNLTKGSLAFFKNVLSSGKNFQIFSFGYKMQRNGNTIKIYSKKKYEKSFMNTIRLQEKFFTKNLPCHICSCIYEKAFLIEKSLIFTPHIKIGEDIEYLLKSFSLADSFYYESRICFIYQIRDDSAMQGYKQYSLVHFNSFLVIKDCIEKIKNMHPVITKEANFFLANLFIYNLFYYLLSNYKNLSLNKQFLMNKNVLSLNISGIFSRCFIIFIIKMIPLKYLFYLRKNGRIRTERKKE
jgi:UDP-glucose:(glucosyl)LPS beta-1,3-glucosyltransferase